MINKKLGLRLMYNKGKFEHPREVSKLNKIINIYQLNKLNATFTHRLESKSVPRS